VFVGKRYRRPLAGSRRRKVAPPVSRRQRKRPVRIHGRSIGVTIKIVFTSIILTQLVHANNLEKVSSSSRDRLWQACSAEMKSMLDLKW
jgi:hypothetical protein